MKSYTVVAQQAISNRVNTGLEWTYILDAKLFGEETELDVLGRQHNCCTGWNKGIGQ